MGLELRKHLFNKFIFSTVILLIGILQVAYGQSTGDVAITGFNGDGDYEISIVTFVDIAAGTQIFFRDDEWDGVSGFTDGEGEVVYTVPSGGLNKGDVVVINPTKETASNGGAVDETGSYNFSATGDQLYAYMSTSENDPEDNPSTFLFALTTNSSWTSAELQNTGLTEGVNALSNIGGTDNQDNGEYIGTRNNTVSIIKSQIQDVENKWNTTNGNGDQDIAFDTSPFNLVDPPTVAFTTDLITVNESSTSVDLTIELVEASNTAVDIDVTYLGSSSTASATDIGGFSNQTVSFSDSDTSGTTKTVTINLNNDTDFEGVEKAVFQLQNNTTGAIVSPDVVTLTIEDDDSPNIVINEIHADPASGTAGDADGNGSRDSNDDEFIEFVNNQGADIDISNWKVFNQTDLKHTFPEGTIIPASGALVLFGDDGVSPTGNFGGAVVQGTNESATLSLVNSGDTIILKDLNGNTIQNITYESNADNDQSITRDPDITGSLDVKHSEAVNSGGSLFSPGTKVDGTPFGSNHAIAIRGGEGWRMIASPVQNATFDDFFSDFWMQGITGSNNPNGDVNLFSWNESAGNFEVPANITANLTPGKGYFVYLFEDDDLGHPGIQGGFPKIITSDGTENNGSVSVPVTSNDSNGDGISGDAEGWNLLGNPFNTDISAAAVIDALEAVNTSVNVNIYIWDSQNDTWQVVDGSDGSDDTIAPFQAFYIRFGVDGVNGNVEFTKSALEANKGTAFYKDNNEHSFSFNLALHGPHYNDTYTLEFTENGNMDLDRYDAYELFSLNPDAIRLFSMLSNNRLMKNTLPQKLESPLEIPLTFEAPGRSKLTFKWDNKFTNFPKDWEFTLIDQKLDREIDLRRSTAYSFNQDTDGTNKKSEAAIGKPQLLKASRVQKSQQRFILSVNPKAKFAQEQELPEAVKLNPNYPNPFNPQTTIPYELAEESQVKLTIWNMIGQKVATLVDGVVEAGTHQETWNATDMPSGIYIARFEVAGKVFIRKMTLIK